MSKTVTVLGSTGSIGTQALEVIEMQGYEVTALTAGVNTDIIEKQIRKFKPKYAAMADEKAAEELKIKVADTDTVVLSGVKGICECASLGADYVLNSIVGMAGLEPTIAAINAGSELALANKETLVAGGELVMRSAAEKKVKIYPIDSEHSAIFQCLQGNDPKQLHKIILTASGGPFFGKTKDELRNVTVEQALNHPNWSMGSKITIDSATLMNKGLEFIEAKWLFDVKPENIEIVVNRESVLHSAVEFDDYSVIGQLGTPDMKIPIQYAILYPQRVECDVKPLSLTDYGTLSFYKPDYDTFECLASCIKAIKKGGAYPCIANSVNEEAVALFLNRKIPFLKIGELVSEAVEKFEPMSVNSYEDIVKADKAAREFVLGRV